MAENMGGPSKCFLPCFQYLLIVIEHSVLDVVKFRDQGWYLSVGKVKGTVMQIEKALTNDCVRVSKVSGKFRVPIIYNFALIYL